jgi:glycosyltransferase involved in cell wall biosynthesis
MSQAPRRIRVLHLIDSLDLGGAQTAILAWLQVHDRGRFEVHLASMHGTPKSLFYPRTRDLKIPVILLSPRRWLPLYLFRLPLELAIGRYDIVHCHLFASNWLGKPLARFFGVPIVVAHDHCNDSLRTGSSLVQWIDGLANRFADQIFAVSASIRDYLVKFEKVPSEKIRVVLNGIPERPRIERPDRSTKLIGGAGRLVPQKNFERFLRIAQILQKIDSTYQFVIAGSGPLDQLLRKKASELGVKVEWLGEQPSLDQFFHSIDLFLLTSDFEGLPMTLLEALQGGVPTAAMAIDGIREEFRDEIALLDPTSNDLEIGRRIHVLLQDRKELSAQIQRGIELVSRRFSARTLIGEIEHDYLELLARKGNCSRGGGGLRARNKRKGRTSHRGQGGIEVGGPKC